jgi:hypothetical protein
MGNQTPLSPARIEKACQDRQRLNRLSHLDPSELGVPPLLGSSLVRQLMDPPESVLPNTSLGAPKYADDETFTTIPDIYGSHILPSSSIMFLAALLVRGRRD